MVYVLYISLVYVDFRFSLALLFFEGIQYGNLDVVIRTQNLLCVSSKECRKQVFTL